MKIEDDNAVLFDVEGHTGVVTLNRPKALNALTRPMVVRIDEALSAWEHDPAIAQVLIRGAGERGLCAGGDIRAIYEDARVGGGGSAGFWRDEYRLNARIAGFSKPYVALMDGFVMGGGVGVSAHGSVRIVTERSRVAMPETGIGFVPDVGGTFLLALAPGELGTHLALTGAVVGAADALVCGLADHFVPSEALAGLVADLAVAPVGEVLERYVAVPPVGVLAGSRGWIDGCYAGDSAEVIVERLLAHGDVAAREAGEALLGKSPTAVKVTLAALRRVAGLGPLERVLEQEYRVSCNALASADLVEGIRAQVIDKDRTPRWSPATLAEVTDGDVARYFTPLGAGELRLTDAGTAAGAGPGSGPAPGPGDGRG